MRIKGHQTDLKNHDIGNTEAYIQNIYEICGSNIMLEIVISIVRIHCDD